MAQQSLSLPYLLLAGTAAVALVLSVVLFRPQFNEWRATRTEAAALEAKVAERQAFLATIDQKTAELRTNAAADQELGVLLPADESFDDVVRLLDRHAATSGVQIKKVDNTTAQTQAANRVAEALGATSPVPTTVTVHGATINLQGSYQQLRQFLGLLENTARFMDVADIALAPVDKQTDLLNGTIVVNFYSLSPTP